jgi:uncharacterized membrane protein YwaF
LRPIKNKIMVLICLLYIIPITLNIFYIYSEEDTKKVKDIFNYWIIIVIPFVNIIISIIFMMHFLYVRLEKTRVAIRLKKWWDKLMNTKIRD